jgi:glutaredoxin 3
MAGNPVRRGEGWKSGPVDRIFDRLQRPEFPEPSALNQPVNQPAQSPALPITVYTSAMCGYCVAAKNFLRSKGLQWTEVRIDQDPVERERMLARARRSSVPQIFIGDTHVGGYDDMMALHRAGKLDALLSGDAS